MTAFKPLSPEGILATMKARQNKMAVKELPEVHSQNSAFDKMTRRLSERREEAKILFRQLDIGMCMACPVDDPFAQEALRNHHRDHAEKRYGINADVWGVAAERRVLGLSEALENIETGFVHLMLDERELYAAYYASQDNDPLRGWAAGRLERLAKIRLFILETLYADK